MSLRAQALLAFKTLLFLAILVFAAIVIIPNLIRSRLGPGDVVSPIGSLRTINIAEITYADTYPKLGFSASLAALRNGYDGGVYPSQPTEEHAGLIDDTLASGTKVGYRYTYAPVWDAKNHTNLGYTVHADPISEPLKPPPTWFERVFHAQTKQALPQRHFFSDQSGVIRSEMGRQASATSPPL